MLPKPREGAINPPNSPLASAPLSRPRSPFSGAEHGADVLLFASSTCSLPLSCSRLRSLHLCKNRHQIPQVAMATGKTVVTPGMGASLVSHGTGLKSASPINLQDAPGPSAFLLGLGMAREGAG